jgi:protein SCO1/2
MPNPSASRHRLAPWLMLGALTLLFLIGALSGCSTAQQLVSGPTLTPIPPGGTTYDPPVELTEFSMIDQHGDRVTLSDLKDKPALFYFGYTHCPDVCPLTLAEMSQVANELGDQAGEVSFVFVSVDYQRDTPERLAEYLTVFKTEFIALTTDQEANLQQITESFGVVYELEDVADTQAEYLVAHSSSTFLVDQDGFLRVKFAYRTAPILIAAEIQNLLASVH